MLRPEKKVKITLASPFGKKHVLFYMVSPQSWSDAFQTIKPIFELIEKHYGQVIRPYMVVPEGTPITESGVDLLIDIDGDFARQYAASVLYLTRPDGYIAFRCLAAKQSLLQSAQWPLTAGPWTGVARDQLPPELHAYQFQK